MITNVTVLSSGFIQLPPYFLEKMGIGVGSELALDQTQQGFRLTLLNTKKIPPKPTKDNNHLKETICHDKNIEEILAFSGSWQDLDEDVFSVESIEKRRQQSKRVDE